MKDYTFAYDLQTKGYEIKSEEQFSDCHRSKKEWVEQYLEPTILSARCGWASVKYVVMEHEIAGDDEFVILAGDDMHPMDGRYICVTANSLGAILSSVAKNLW